MRRRVALVLNPAAGSARVREAVTVFVRSLERWGAEVELFETEAPGHARELARRAAAGSDVVVSAGGDGTLNEVITGLHAAGASIPVALLPVGTANVVAKELGLPSSPAELARIALTGEVEELHLGRATEVGGESRLFAMCAGVGLDGEIVERVARRRGVAGIRMSSYLFPALAVVLGYSHPPLQVRVDGREAAGGGDGEAPGFVLVARMQRYGGPLRFFPPIARDDAGLHVCCLRTTGALGLPSLALRALLHRVPGSNRASYFRGRVVEVCCREPERVPVQVDGEAGFHTPVRFETVERPVGICVPRIKTVRAAG